MIAPIDRHLFNAATRVTLGDGLKVSFLSSSWLNGQTLQGIAPQIFQASKRKKALVHDALTDSRWIADISMENFSVEHITQFVNLWGLLQEVTIRLFGHSHLTDHTLWARLIACSSLGRLPTPLRRWFGRVGRPKCHFFTRLVVQNRL
jgi:hypothetical protein